MKSYRSVLLNSVLLIGLSCTLWRCQDEDNDIANRNYQLVWEDNLSR